MWAIVQHVSYDGEGNVGHALRRAGQPWRNVRAYRGEPLPKATDLSGLVVLGAPGGSAEDRETEHLVAERQLIAEAVGLGLPVLGVCFGAQLLAVALGGHVVTGGGLEVGMGPAALTDAGCADPVLGGGRRELTVLHWHRDRYTLPPGALRLASSGAGTEQAFRLDHTVYGLQFHVEINRDLAEVIADQMPAGALEPAVVAGADRWGGAVLDRFVALGAKPVRNREAPALGRT